MSFWKVVGLSLTSLIVGFLISLFLSSSGLFLNSSGELLWYRLAVPFSPLPPRFTVSPPPPELVPVILVGELIEDSRPVFAPQASEWDNRPVQLWKARVRVEHVLQGTSQPSEVEVFYFPDMGSGGGGGRSRVMRIPSGRFEMFFLQPDGGKLRTICDGWDSCMIWVRTGGHSNFRRDPALPIGDVLAQLLLSRGDKTTDDQMIDAIYHPNVLWGLVYLENALKKLAEVDKSTKVQVAARQRLQRGSPWVSHLPDDR